MKLSVPNCQNQRKYVTRTRILESIRQEYQKKENFLEVYSKVEKLITAVPLNIVTRIKPRVFLLGNRRILSIILNLKSCAIQCNVCGYIIVNDLGDYHEYSEPCQELIDILNREESAK